MATAATKAAATAKATTTTTTTATATATQRGWYRVMKRGRSALAALTGQRARNGACRSCSRSHGDCRECSGDGGSGHQLLRSHVVTSVYFGLMQPRAGPNRQYIGCL
jgi:hypothetical protein